MWKTLMSKLLLLLLLLLLFEYAKVWYVTDLEVIVRIWI